MKRLYYIGYETYSTQPQGKKGIHYNSDDLTNRGQPIAVEASNLEKAIEKAIPILKRQNHQTDVYVVGKPVKVNCSKIWPIKGFFLETGRPIR